MSQDTDAEQEITALYAWVSKQPKQREFVIYVPLPSANCTVLGPLMDTDYDVMTGAYRELAETYARDHPDQQVHLKMFRLSIIFNALYPWQFMAS
jgi:hypothetical protein